MNDSLILLVGVFVFVMALVGLGLTALEFRYGQPRREERAKRRSSSRRTRATASTALEGARG